MYTIVETDVYGNTYIADDGCIFYLNHSCLGSMSFGSEDMAWTTESELEAEGMLQRVIEKKGGNHKIIEI